MSEAKNEVNSYQILDYLGVGQEKQKKMMKKQVALLYFLPVLPAAFIDILVFPMMTGRIVRDSGGMVQIISVAAGMKQKVLLLVCSLCFSFCTILERLCCMQELL